MKQVTKDTQSLHLCGSRALLLLPPLRPPILPVGLLCNQRAQLAPKAASSQSLSAVRSAFIADQSAPDMYGARFAGSITSDRR